MEIKAANFCDQYFSYYCRDFFGPDFDWLWFRAIAMTESSMDSTAVSPAGAEGLMQLMPATSKWMAEKLGIHNNPFNPQTNIKLGVAYACDCFSIFKEEIGRERIRFMLGAYNAGPGHIIRAQLLVRERGLPTDLWSSIVTTLPSITGKHSRETIAYVEKVECYYQQLNDEKEGERI